MLEHQLYFACPSPAPALLGGFEAPALLLRGVTDLGPDSKPVSGILRLLCQAAAAFHLGPVAHGHYRALVS